MSYGTCASSGQSAPDGIDVIMSIMRAFPLLAAEKGFTHWTGFIYVKNNMFRMDVTFPNFPFSHGVLFHGDKDSLPILTKFQDKIVDEAQAPLSTKLAPALLQELKDFVADFFSSDSSENNNVTIGNPSLVMAVCDELDVVGTENIETVAEDFDNVSLKYVDYMGRKHVIKLQIPQGYPDETVQIKVDLPTTSTNVEWPPRLCDAYEKFRSEVDKYISFWNVLDDLDCQAKVIDPVQPMRADVYRRILLSRSVVVNLLFNPLCPKALPEIKFSGPEKCIQDLDDKLEKNLQAWSDKKSVLENLEEILDCEFLLKCELDETENGNAEAEDIESLCLICYAFEFEDKVPEITCDCGSVFHEKCLSDLFVNDCSTKSKRLCVDCPKCEMELKVKVPKNHKVAW